ncbi:MAG: TetR/AcrR family transcriptional regulator C-terminal domain-containing protein [Mycobacteriales bacterium]
MAYPMVLISVQRRPVAHPLALQTIEGLLESLTAAGLPARTVVATYAQIFGFGVTGMAAVERSRAGVRQEDQLDEAATKAQLRAARHALPPEEFPALRRNAEEFAEAVSSAHFDAAVDQIVAGLDAQLGQRGRSRRR